MNLRLLVYHAGLVSAGLIVAATGVSVARFMRKRSWWLTLHRRLAAGGIFLVLSGIAVAIIKVELRGGSHLAFPHAYMGTVIFVFALLTPLLGVLQFRIRHQAAQIRMMHRWSGRLLILLLTLNVLSGLIITGVIG